jgi:hypothetical protein
LAIDSYGGMVALNVLARIIGSPVSRVLDLLTVIQRILNIDGYSVMAVDRITNTVLLNRDLLCQQFGLKL